MFIAKDYELRLEAPACEPGAEYWNATAVFRDDLSPVFPYLNALWKDAIYSPAAKQMTLRIDNRAVALKPNAITISNLPDRDTAVLAMERVVSQINRTWMDRDELEPLHTARRRLVAMEIYRLLPQTNCKRCDHPSCFALATKITVGEAHVSACLPLLEEAQYQDKRQALLDLLALASA